MKKNLVLIIVFAALVFSFVANAIPNPSAVYCTDLGFEYLTKDTPEGQDGFCIFPDKTECSAWDYYNKCNDGQDNECEYPCGELPCKQAGESVQVAQCCEDLQKIAPTTIYDKKCNDAGIVGWTNICSDCGNEACEEWENYCNCPEDCPKQGIENTALFIIVGVVLVLIILIWWKFIKKR